jgi:Zn-dependent protease
MATSSEDADLPAGDDLPHRANSSNLADSSAAAPCSNPADRRLAAVDRVFAGVSLPEVANASLPVPVSGRSLAVAGPYSVQFLATGAPLQSGAKISAATVADLSAEPTPSPRPPRRWIPVVLFLATCLTTFWAGACHGDPLAILNPLFDGEPMRLYWVDGLCYMAAVMTILFAHEMGHYLQAVRYRVPTGLPIFLPMPLTPIGTMGAVIRMQGGRADRKQLFDIGISGPLAGLLFAIPIAWYGIATAGMVAESTLAGRLFQNPLFFQSLEAWLRPDLQAGMVLDRQNPFWMAGWVGMLITGLNMLPLSQLDGGHISYALLGKRAHLLARFLLLGIAIFILSSNQYAWCVMFVLVMVIGADHPPTADDHAPLGWKRRLLGWLSLLIPVLCLAPVPVT